MKLNLESTEPDVRIEVVPLIDVIFCILTFFILAAVTVTRQAAINVDLPRAGSGTTQMREMLIVSVDPIGQTYLEKVPVSKEQLQQAVLNFRQQKPEGLIVLYASRSSSYNDVVQVLDQMRAAGGDRVALATLPGESDGSSALPTPSGSLLPSGNSLPLNPAATDPLPLDLAPNNSLPGSGQTGGNRSGTNQPLSPSGGSGLPGSSSNRSTFELPGTSSPRSNPPGQPAN